MPSEQRHRGQSRLNGPCRALFGGALFAFSVLSNAQEGTSGNLADLTLEDLANLQITSVSRHAERLTDAPASIYVITGEDIRRAGANSVPEALRLAPNLAVARLDSRQYAISARGFNSAIANKLLVLIDGRTVYTPLFSGVFWDAQDVFIEDIDRIEVISGPGATLWGANAVNGVINIITRSATDTKGTLAYVGGGNNESGIGARYGTQLNGGGGFRVYAKAFGRDNTVRSNGTDVADAWRSAQAGFRGDWGPVTNGFTLQGDAYRGTIDQLAPGDVRISGGNLLGRWTRQLASGGRFEVQTYLDRTEREIPGTLTERLDTFDVSFQHGLKTTSTQSLSWGGGHRYSSDHVVNGSGLAFLPAARNMHWTNLFVQDEVTLRDGLLLSIGAKVERNPYTGWEFLPSARFAWKPSGNRTIWGSVARAVRAPARLDRELFAPAQAPFLLAGGPGFRSEIARVLEFGYRAQPSTRATYSLSVFHSAYDHLRSVEPIGGGAFVIGNEMEGTVSGLEAWGTFQAASFWRLSAGAVFLHPRLRFKPGSGDNNVAAAGNDVRSQFSLRSSMDLPGQRMLDIIARHVSGLPHPVVPSYTAIDVRYAFRLRNDLEFSVVAQDLFDRSHPEFGADPTRSEIGRGLFVKLIWTQ